MEENSIDEIWYKDSAYLLILCVGKNRSAIAHRQTSGVSGATGIDPKRETVFNIFPTCYEFH